MKLSDIAVAKELTAEVLKKANQKRLYVFMPVAPFISREKPGVTVKDIFPDSISFLSKVYVTLFLTEDGYSPDEAIEEFKNAYEKTDIVDIRKYVSIMDGINLIGRGAFKDYREIK